MISGVTIGSIVFFALVLIAIFTSRLVLFRGPIAYDLNDDMVTVIMPTFNRNMDVVTNIIHTYLDNQLVKDVFLVQFETGNDIPVVPSPILNRSWKTFSYPNDLRHRFNPISQVDSPYILITDDDLIIKKNYLNNLIHSAKEEPDLFHGLDGRNLIYNKKLKVFKYKTKSPPILSLSQRVDILLTSCLVSYTPTMKRALHIYKTQNEAIAYPFNGEDIAFCMSNGRHRAKLWNWNKIAWNAHEFPHSPGKTTIASNKGWALSARKDHVRERSNIANSLVKTILTRRPLYIYFHVCAIKHWKSIVKKSFDYLKKLNVFNIITELRVCIVGDADVTRDGIWSYHPKVKIHATNPNIKLFERFTLHRLRDDSKKETFNAFYMHSKGVTKGQNVKWIEQMLKSCWNDHTKLLFDLQVHDAAGVLLTNYLIGAHFSGNFWWSKSEYLKKLENITGGYLDPEKWILASENCRVLHVNRATNYNREYTKRPGTYQVSLTNKPAGGRALGRKYVALAIP